MSFELREEQVKTLYGFILSFLWVAWVFSSYILWCMFTAGNYGGPHPTLVGNEIYIVLSVDILMFAGLVLFTRKLTRGDEKPKSP